MENVKKHFEEEAEEFDKTIQQLIPLYSEMIDSMINAIPYNISDKFKVLDLGCGTGNVSKAVKERFPMATIDCIDIADNMIEMAKIKLEDYNDIKYYTGDFSEFDFEAKYDIVVSSLALHHIKTDEEKKRFYIRIYGVLSNGGVFLNSDSVLGSNENLNEIYMKKWVEFMLQNVPKGCSMLYLPRSTLLRSFISVHTAVGDPGFYGTLQFMIYNYGEFDYTVKKGERIAQGVVFDVTGSGEYNGSYQEDE